MDSLAVLLEAPERLSLATLTLDAPGDGDVLVEVAWSGISAGTEKLLWTGRMPTFPGMGYPLVPGYESIGRVVDAGCDAYGRVGEWVFVPGADCFRGAKGLFGATARRVILPSARAIALPESLGSDGVLLALAATAHHAIVGGAAPELVVGAGVLGRLIVRVAEALGHARPTLWEADPVRRGANTTDTAIDAAIDPRRDYAHVCDASGDTRAIDALMPRLAHGGEIVLAGFYDRIGFNFAPAFMREARLRIAAEFKPADVHAVLALVAAGKLSLAGLITDVRSVAGAAHAYPTAFAGGDCLKLVLDWTGV